MAANRHTWQKKLIERGKALHRKRIGAKRPFATDGFRVTVERPVLAFGRKARVIG